MKKYGYLIIGLVLHVGWFFLVFHTLRFTASASFVQMYEFFNGDNGETEGTSKLFTITAIMQISVVVYTIFLFFGHIWFFKRSKLKAWMKLLQFLLIVAGTVLTGSIFMYWWNNAPPMSEQAALKYAEKQIGDYMKHVKFRSIRLNGNEWVVQYQENNNENNCTKVKIRRNSSYTTGGTCE